jgi:CRP/FNR family transcriptional regulator, cyclic AMP receptor protein
MFMLQYGWTALEGNMLQESKSIRREFDKRSILRNHPIFGEFRPDLLERLSSHAARKTVRSGTAIFARGDPGTCLFAVCSGTVRISAPSPAGRSAIFNLISEGAVFGEIALLDGLPRTADAMALTECELMVIERRDFIPLLREQPEIALKVIEVLCGRLRRTTEQLADVMFLDLPGRLAKALLQLAKSAKPTPRGPKIALTQDDVGKIIGISRESTNKQLREWEGRNWLALERGGIVILAAKALEKIAETADG